MALIENLPELVKHISESKKKGDLKRYALSLGNRSISHANKQRDIIIKDSEELGTFMSKILRDGFKGKCFVDDHEKGYLVRLDESLSIGIKKTFKAI